MKNKSTNNQSGIGCLGGLIVGAIVLLGLLYGADKAFIYYQINCTEETLEECLFHRTQEEQPPEGGVTATGSYSLKGRLVTVTMHVPLSGGSVTGQISGDCSGKVKGSFDGQNNGVISGTINGACPIFVVDIPAKATYQGIVNKDAKTVPISFTGSGGGFTKSDSMALSY